MAYISAYHYQIRSKEGTVGYVGKCQGKYVFTPLTYPEFAAAMLMAKALNKRTKNEHEIVSVQKRRNINGRYGPMRRSAVPPVMGNALAAPKARNESPPEVIAEGDYSANDVVEEGTMPSYPCKDVPNSEMTEYYKHLEEVANLIPEIPPEKDEDDELEVEICS